MVLKDAIDKILGVNASNSKIDDLVLPDGVMNPQARVSGSDTESFRKIDQFFEKQGGSEREIYLTHPNPDRKVLYECDRVDLVIKGMKNIRANIRKAQGLCVYSDISQWRVYEEYANSLDTLISGLEGRGVIVDEDVVDTTFGPKKMIRSDASYPFATLETYLEDHPELGYKFTHSLRIRDGNGKFISPQKLADDLKDAGLIR